MSEVHSGAEPSQPGPACPLPLSVLASTFQKHVDPNAPIPLRMMGAKALVPMGPRELPTALFMLTFDADAGVRETAAKSAAGLPDRILAVALRDETMDPPVLEFYAGLLRSKDEYLEMIVLNAATSDATVAHIAASGSDRLVEIIAQNQLRILRHADIVRALVKNPLSRPSTLDSVTDFCVRSGLLLEDLPAFKAARRRILGGAAADEDAAIEAAAKRELEVAAAEDALVAIGATAPDDIADHAEELLDPDAPEDDEHGKDGKRLSITQQIMKLTVAKKVEWANKKGNKEVRTILLRDPNKLVQLAVIQSPRITQGEIAKVALSRTAPNEVLSNIYNNRQLVKNYPIKVALINNPKVPVGVSMRFLSSLRTAEVKALAKNKNIPQGLAVAAKKLLEKKSTGG
jgi:hypothetical protein